MMLMGFFEALLLLAAGISNPTHDLVSFLRAEDYFKARAVPLNVEEMVKCSLRNPTDGKTQIQQLLAIRWLGENPKTATKSPQALQALKDLAEAKKGQDPHGFARIYAQQALARLEGKPLPTAVHAQPSSLKEAISWFSRDTNVCFASELVPARSTIADGPDPIREMIALVLQQNQNPIYDAVEKIGNIRLDRVAFGLVVDEQKGITKIQIRLSGAGNAQRLAAYLQSQQPGSTIRKIDGPKGQVVQLIETPQRPPTMTLIGDRELLITGYSGNEGDHTGLAEDMLKVAAGNRESVQAGKLRRMLSDMPKNARTLVAASIPEKYRADVQQAIMPGIPEEVAGFVAVGDPVDASKAGLRIQLTGYCANAEAAKQSQAALETLRKGWLVGLKKLPGEMRIDDKTIQVGRTALEQIQLSANGSEVRMKLEMADERTLMEAGIKMIQQVFTRTFTEGRPAAPPPPVAVPIPPARP